VITRLRWTIAIGFAIIVSVCGGGFVGSRLTSRQDTEAIHAVMLSAAALKTTEYTTLVKGIRGGNQECVADRLETLLDFAVIDLARE
jgi:hypothetical protein